MSARWIVTVEAAGTGADRELLGDGLEHLVELLADARPVVLYDHDRYSLQLEIVASSAAAAATQATKRWAAAASAAGLPEWEAVRVEVLSEEEFAREATQLDTASYGELRDGARAAAFHRPDLGSAAADVLRQVCAHTGWPAGHLAVVGADDAPPALIPTSTWWTDDATRFADLRAATESYVWRATATPAGRALATGKVCVADTASLDTDDVTAILTRATRIDSVVAVPVRADGEVVAVLSFFVGESAAVADEVLSMLAEVGAELGTIVTRKRVRAAAVRTDAALRTDG